MNSSPTYSVLITASGRGERLGDWTKTLNKALVRVGRKPAIAYIIDSYPKESKFVITLRHMGKQVEDFLRLAYPEHHFIFVYEEEDPRPGEAFSLGRSMLQARKHLNEPFIFQCCDTLILDKIPPPAFNWNGVSRGVSSAQYSSVSSLDQTIMYVNAKGALNFDYLHIGLVGIFDHQGFWNTLENLFKENPLNSTLNDCQVINRMIKNESIFQVQEFSKWYDTGNVESLQFAREHVPDRFHNLDKVGEAIYLFDDFAIKFFDDLKNVENRVLRAQTLKGLVPEIQGHTRQFYRYTLAKGRLYSHCVKPENFTHFLDWAEEHLWEKTDCPSTTFHEACRKFYHDKTLDRVQLFFASQEMEDHEDTINGQVIPPLSALLLTVDWERLCETEPCRFHGDLILDNIIQTQTAYLLLDWRQDFGELLEAGDLYYDLSKLNHNLIVNHDIVSANQFTVKRTGEGIVCDIMRSDNLVRCQEVLFDFILKKGFDEDKIQLITALIWLNMAPLHHYPFNLFLFYFGKLNLWRTLKKTGRISSLMSTEF